MKKRLTNTLRLTAAGALVLAAATTAQAKPAYRGNNPVTQPDGTTLITRLTGDERAHMTFTEDGIPLAYDDELGYVYADFTANGELVPTGMTAHNAANRNAAEIETVSKIDLAALPAVMEKARANNTRRKAQPARTPGVDQGYGLCFSSFPSKGVQKGLAILVEYTDVKFNVKNDEEYKYEKYSNSDDPVYDYWNDLLNKEGFDTFGATGSARDWFHLNSAGPDGTPQFSPEFDLYGPVTLPQSMSYYGRNSGLYGDEKHAHEMVMHACTILDDEIDFAEYDRDGDGYVDNVYIFYAGYGEADGGGTMTVWPHSWDLRYAGATFELDGVIFDHYACSNEVSRIPISEVAVKSVPDGIGTFVHEFSHVLGLPDLYETNYTLKGSYTPGEYSVLDYGPYNNNGLTPPNYSAYERWALGWLTPEKYKADGNYSLGNLADTNHAFVVPTEKETEYYLVENRQHTGWDEYIPGHGMLIWHVDYDENIFEQNVVNNQPSHQYVDLIEANNNQNIWAAAGHPFPGTANVTAYQFRSWANKDCGVILSEIAENADGTISKHVINKNYSAVSSIIDENDGKENAEYYNLQGIRIDRPSKGMYIRVAGGKATVRTSE